MSLELLTGQLEVDAELAARALEIAISTLNRWNKNGVRLPDGSVIFPPSYKLGKKRLYPVQGLIEFAEANKIATFSKTSTSAAKKEGGDADFEIR